MKLYVYAALAFAAPVAANAATLSAITIEMTVLPGSVVLMLVAMRGLSAMRRNSGRLAEHG